MKEDIYAKLKSVADELDANFFGMWGVTGGNRWICVRQDDENDYTIQLRFSEFKSLNNAKKRIVEILEAENCRLNDECDEDGYGFGYCKNFIFIDKKKYDEKKEAAALADSSLRPNTYIETQITGDIHSSGAFQTGSNATASTSNNFSDEKHWLSKEIVKSILTFLSGVAATLLAQYLIRLLGWIQ